MAVSASSSLLISNYSRYKDTPIYLDSDEVIRFALQVQPREFLFTVTGATQHRVAMNEVGFLDILAVRYFGAGLERLWWIIAEANAMIDPEQEMYPGQLLVIPPQSAVQQFLSRQGDVST